MTQVGCVPTVPAETTAAVMHGLGGENVLVTGGTSGIGPAIAGRFAEYGGNVAINYLQAQEEATDTEEQVHTCLARVRQPGVRDVLVRGDVPAVKVLAVNLRAAFLCARETSKRFLGTGTPGVITNVSSVHGQTIFVDGGLTLFADFREPWSSE